MPHRSLTVLAVLLAVGIAHAQPKKPKQAIVAPAWAGFTTTFPSEPSQNAKDLATAAGNVSVHTFRAEHAGAVYAVVLTEYPESFADTSADKILDGVRDGLKGDGELKTETKFTAGEAAGRELEVVVKKKNDVKSLIRGRAVLSNRKLYLVTVTGDPKVTGGDTATDFLKSFSLTN